jgi:hypothetical protein
LTLEVGGCLQNDIGSRVVTLLVPASGEAVFRRSASVARQYKPLADLHGIGTVTRDILRAENWMSGGLSPERLPEELTVGYRTSV